MRVVLDLAFKNLKKYTRESFLVILSILLTVSMMTMVASTMSSLYSSLMQHRIKTGENRANAEVFGIVDIKGFVDEIRDELSSYYIHGQEESYMNDDDSFYVNATSYPTCNIEDIDYWCLKDEIIEGRKSENKHEIVVHKISGYRVGDTLTLNHYDYTLEQIIGEIEVMVVGINNSSSDNNFFVSEEEISQTDTFYSIAFVFKDGTKNIDKKLKKAIDTKKYTIENSNLELNSDYNFFMGMQNTPGPLLLATATTTLIMLLLVGVATISLTLNALESLITQQEKSIGTLRSIGMTKNQLKKMIIIQGFALSGIGIFAGIILGVLLGRVLISYVFMNMNDMFVTLGAENIYEIFFDTSAWMYVITVISGFLIIYFAQRKKLKALFSKTSIETLRELKLSDKKTNVDLSKNPINGLAKINTKMTKDFKGIQTALMISVILLIGINGWVNSFSNAFETQSSYFDSEVEIYENNIEYLEEDTHNIMRILKSYDEIEEIVKIESIDGVRLTENNTLGTIHDEALVKENEMILDYIYVKVLEDEYFNQYVKNEKFNVNTETVFYNLRTVESENDYAEGTLIDFTQTNEIELRYGEEEELYKVKIDANVVKGSKDYEHLYDGPTLYISETYYKENLSSLPKGSSIIHIKSELSKDSLIRLNNELKNLETKNNYFFSSHYFDSYFSLIINKTAFTITSAIFIYIALVILINVINISLSTYRRRKQDIAILMSVGASKKQIEEMFLRESLLISFKPYLKGLIAGNLIAFAMVKITARLSHEQFVYNLSRDILFISLILVCVIVLVQYLSLIKEIKKLDLITDIKSF